METPESALSAAARDQGEIDVLIVFVEPDGERAKVTSAYRFHRLQDVDSRYRHRFKAPLMVFFLAGIYRLAVVPIIE